MAILAQIEQAFELAGKGATMGGQAILIVFLVLMAYIIRSMHAQNKAQMQQALAAHERQHTELVNTLASERTAMDAERRSNHESLMRVATESAVGLQATAASNVGMATALNSLRETLHALREDMQDRQTKRDTREH